MSRRRDAQTLSDPSTGPRKGPPALLSCPTRRQASEAPKVGYLPLNQSGLAIVSLRATDPRAIPQFSTVEPGNRPELAQGSDQGAALGIGQTRPPPAADQTSRPQTSSCRLGVAQLRSSSPPDQRPPPAAEAAALKETRPADPRPGHSAAQLSSNRCSSRLT